MLVAGVAGADAAADGADGAVAPQDIIAQHGGRHTAKFVQVRTGSSFYLLFFEAALINLRLSLPPAL